MSVVPGTGSGPACTSVGGGGGAADGAAATELEDLGTAVEVAWLEEFSLVEQAATTAAAPAPMTIVRRLTFSTLIVTSAFVGSLL
ncbi:hypothetical protein [Nocardia anaemiae]|uniref:hypothetical protein n=1 Tax=Nocardia anaemiae TaxID=263910 RepID=UPI001470D20E|nr:hypothetical protein [Nocardia anaemiae]